MGDAAGEAEAARREDLSADGTPAAAPPSRDVARPEEALCREEGDPRSGVDFPAEEEEEAPSFFSEDELLEPERILSDEGRE